MRMKRTMRSSSSTTKTRRRSNSSGMLFPHKTNQVFFCFVLKNFNQSYLDQGPEHFDDILFKKVNILAITQTWITDNDNIVTGFGQFFNLTNNGWLPVYMQNYGVCHACLP